MRRSNPHWIVRHQMAVLRHAEELTGNVNYRRVEEKGFGAEHFIRDDRFETTEEWDIPETHAEEMAAHGYCWRCQSGETDMLASDCPGAPRR